MTLSRRPWEDWWEKFAEEDFMRKPDEENHPLRIRMCNEAAKVGGTVLDIGCGTAIDYPRLTQLGLKYMGIDITPKFVARAKQLYPEMDVREGNVFNLTFPNRCFDVVYAKGLIQHLPPGTYPEALKSMWYITKTLLMFSTNCPFVGGPTVTVSNRTLGGAFTNYYNYKEFIDYCNNILFGSRLTIKYGYKAADEKRAHTLFIVYRLEEPVK